MQDSSTASPSAAIPSDEIPSSFVANHHRANNPNDAKLKASLKSRRTSLIGSVLKGKPYRRPSLKAVSPASWSRGISSETAMSAGSDFRPHSSRQNGTEVVGQPMVASPTADKFEPNSASTEATRPLTSVVPVAKDAHTSQTSLLTGSDHQHNPRARPEIGPRVRSLRTGETFSPQAHGQHQVTIIATPPTPIIPDSSEPSSPTQPSSEGASTPPLASPTSMQPDGESTPIAPSQTYPILPTRTSSNSSFELAEPASEQAIPASPSVPSSSPRRSTSLRRTPSAEASRKTLTSSSAQDLTAGLDLPTMYRNAATHRKERRRMSMLDFLSADLDSHQIAEGPSLRQPVSAQRRRTDGPSSVPLSMPLLEATRRLAVDTKPRKEVQVSTSMVDFSEHVGLKVEPLTDRLTMFGSTQTSSNYSLAGTVVVEIPRDTRRHVIPSVPDWSPNGAQIPAAKRPSIAVKALSVRYIGYSVYVDATGRFNALKLADVSQDLLQPEGCVCYTDVDEDSQAERTNAALRYEIEFDLSIPGWLPASQHSRFGGTFYCIQAEATVDGQRIVSHVSERMAPSSPHKRASLDDRRMTVPDAKAQSGVVSEPQDEFSSLRNKGKGNWLGKTAKQLQLRSIKKAFPQDGSQTADITGRPVDTWTFSMGTTSQLQAKSSESSSILLPSGMRNIKSECTSILIQRCRDVVPVPVARLALDRAYNTPTAGDSAPQSLLAAVSGSASTSLASAQAMAASTSAPGSLADNGAVAQSRARLNSLPQSVTPSAAEQPSTVTSAAVATTRVDAPKVQTKLAAPSSMSTSATMPNLTSTFSRASSLADSRFGNAQSPPRTSSRAPPASQPTAPMRHFLHRPVLQLPGYLGIIGDNNVLGALSFSLTLSLPSHVQVTGPRSDTLSFGVQIEVGKTEGWNVVRKLGGLRIKDMELVCLQTERHSSMPSRSFSAAFPLPPPPNKVEASDLPVLSVSSANSLSSTEARLRRGYDRELVLQHIDLANTGKAPDPIEHNVERVRTTIVGPPPSILRKARASKGPSNDAPGKGKAKAKDIPKNVDRTEQLSRQQSASGSGSNTPDRVSGGLSGLRAAFAPVPQPVSGSGSSIMQPVPRSLARSRNTSSSSLRLTPSGENGPGSVPPSPHTYSGPTSRIRRPLPFEAPSVPVQDSFEGSVPNQEAEIVAEAQPSSATATAPRDSVTETAPSEDTASKAPNASSSADGTLPRSSSNDGTGQRPQTRRRRFENAMNRLSTFASSMLEANTENGQTGPESQTAAQDSRGAAVEGGLRATYAFAGDDGQGVDLTKGRVRMTINLPLVSNDSDTARRAGGSQLVPDFESPYVRIRHKLKVKLGFGLNCDTADAPHSGWSQALVMCVPVRFTEAPPQDVQDHFAPQAAQPADQATSAERSAEQGDVTPTTAPLLPAYTQLFREDGSRLADEGEDLPRYPGRISVVGEIETDPSSSTAAAPMLSPDGESGSGVAADAGPAPSYVASDPDTPLTTNPALTSRSTSLRGRKLLLQTATAAAPASLRSSSHSVLYARNPVPTSVGTAGTTAPEPSAFDPLPVRPGMRQRSATSASLVSFSRIAPAEVLDEALVINSREEEEDRMETMQLDPTDQTLGLDAELDEDGDDEDMALGVNMLGEDHTSSDSEDEERAERTDERHFAEGVHPSEAEEIVQVGQAW